MTEPADTPQQTPEQTQRAVRALLIASPLPSVFSYFFAEFQAPSGSMRC